MATPRVPELPETPPAWAGRLALRVLECLSPKSAEADPIRGILRAIVEETGIQCAAIRLRDGADFPFHVSEGFSQEFLRHEDSLAQPGPDGLPLTDTLGHRALACFCGAVLTGQTDSLSGCFTEAGSFCAGSLRGQLRASDLGRVQGYRGQCVAAGFETQVLIPLREAAETIGLLHLSDRRTQVLSRGDVEFLERLGASIGVALVRRRAESTEAALASSEARFHKLVDLSPDAVYLQRDGRFTFANAAGLALLGAGQPQELIGTPVIDRVHPDFRERVSEWVEAAQGGGASAWLAEEKLLRLDGSAVDVEVARAPVDLPEGRVVQVIARDIADRVQVRERLRESEERWRAVVLNEPECVKLLDREGRVVDMNPAGLAMIQARLDQVQGQRANGLVAPEDRAAFDLMVADVFRGERRHLVFDMIGLEGRRLTLETTSVPLWDSPARRQVSTLLGVTRDVTERRRTEEALQCLATSFAHLSGKAFFEAVSGHLAGALGVDCVFVGQLNATEDSVRVVGGHLRGEAMDELLYPLAGTPCDDVVSKRTCTYPAGVQSLFPEDEYLARLGVESYVGAPVFDKRQHPIGILVALHSQPLSNPKAVTELFGMFLDHVSAEMQRIEAQRALEKSEERMRLFFERQIVGMAITTPEQGWVQVNQRFCQMLGFSSQELARLSWAELIHPEDLEQELAQFDRLLGGEIDDYSMEKRFIRRDGGAIHANLSVACVRRGDGSVDYVLRLLEDVTERKWAQESAKRSERMAAMGSLVAGVAHEVRNPLFAIQANVDALGAVLGPEADVGELLEAMRKEVDRLRQLMEELLEYGKPSQPRFNLEGLQPCLQLALRECLGPARATQVELRCGDAPAALWLRLDRGRLAQVFENVVMNAIQHSPQGGQVSLGFEDFLEGGRRWVRCLVEDQGPGFRAEDLRRIFDPFFTRRRGGTGLGLAIAQRIVEEHGGRILVENRRVGGARVVIELPASTDARDASPAGPACP